MLQQSKRELAVISVNELAGIFPLGGPNPESFDIPALDTQALKTAASKIGVDVEMINANQKASQRAVRFLN